MWLKINKIKTKLQLYFLMLILIAIAIGGVSFVYMQRIWTYYTLRNQVDKLLVINPKLIKAEQQFILHDSKDERFHENSESTNLSKYQAFMKKMRGLLEDIEANPLSKKLQVEETLINIRTLLQTHHQTFMTLVDKFKRRGFKDYGIEGKMRQAIHLLQKNDTLNQISLLTLRKHEKDFFLRKDLMYADSVKNESERLLKLTKDSIQRVIRRKMRLTGISDTMSLANMALITETVNLYVKQFDKIVNAESEIGLDEKSGLLGVLGKNSQKIESELTKIDAHIDFKTRDLFESSTILIVIFFLLILCLAVIFAFVVSYRIAKPIITLDRIAQSVTKGLRNQEQLLDTIKSKDEIGSLARNFKLMLLKLKKTIQQANEKNKKLEEFAQNEALRLWHTEGLTIFGEIFRNNNGNLEQQAYQIISELVKYTRSTQGGLFVVNKDDENNTFLELKGCYAYERKKYQQKRIDLGEGLVGTAWREEHTILINEVPQDYTHITSGLGKGKPNCLLIAPIKSDNQVEGVIELISFHTYEKHEIEFIESLSQRIATALVAIKASERTKRLLEISEKIAFKAQEQESKLKKQLEDYQYWVQQFESKLNVVSEEATIYQAIISNVFAGLIITNEKYQIIQVNNYITKRFNYRKKDLIGQFIDVIIDSDYTNVFDLKDHQFTINFKSFNQKTSGRVIDKRGKVYFVETLIGKLEMDTKLVYVFLFNEMAEDSQNQNPTTSTANKEVNLKVAS